MMEIISILDWWKASFDTSNKSIFNRKRNGRIFVSESVLFRLRVKHSLKEVSCGSEVVFCLPQRGSSR